MPIGVYPRTKPPRNKSFNKATCIICKRDFECPPSDGSRKYCSRRCYDHDKHSIRRLRMINDNPMKLPENRARISLALSGSNNGQWKGLYAPSGTKHIRIYKRKGKAKHCENCSMTSTTYHWANLSHDYDKEEDYIQLCPKCHRSYDLGRISIRGRFIGKPVMENLSLHKGWTWKVINGKRVWLDEEVQK